MTRSIKFLLAMMLLFSSGFGVLAEAGNKIEKYSWLLLLDKPNQPPVIDPEIAIQFNWPTDSVQLDVRVTDDPNDDLVYEWTQLSGPSVVTFSNRFAEDTTATFPVYGETYVLELSVSDGELTSTVQVTVPFNFLASYTNPEQVKVPADGMYPLGQRMPVSAYSTNDGQRLATAAAGFTADGPHYHGRGSELDPHALQWTLAKSLGMKGYYRFHSIGASNWNDVVATIKTVESRAKLTAAITGMVNDVLSNPELNDFVDAWYGFQEEIITRSSPPLTEQRAFHAFVHDIIKKLDTRKKRPYYVSERRDSDTANLAGNACLQDGVMKQDALIEDSGYTDDILVRGIMRQWAIDAVKTAADADVRCPSYTGQPRAAIATLSSAWDPSDPANRNETWLRNIITYDVYIQLAMGTDGFSVFSYAWKSHSTAALQQRLYNEILGGMIKKGLGKVFLWGQDRDDVTKTITSGPTTMTWKFGKTHTIPSVDMRNIQYGNSRYILLVNNSKETITITLSNFPGSLKLLNMQTGESMSLGTSISTSIEPLGVLMYKIEQS